MADGSQLFAAKLFHNLPVHRQAEMNWTDADLSDRKELRHELGSAHAPGFTMREQQSLKAVYALGTKKWFGDELNGVGRAAVHQQIVLSAGRVKKRRMTPVRG